MLLQLAGVFFPRSLGSRKYKIQVIARVGRKSPETPAAGLFDADPRYEPLPSVFPGPLALELEGGAPTHGPHQGFVLVSFTSIFTNITSKFTNILE